METSLQLSDFRGNIVDEFSDLPPSCKICGSYLRPDVVWFGESIKQEVWKEAVKQSMTCDAMIIVGTSLVVSPANTLHFYAKNNQAAIVDINPENTPFVQTKTIFTIVAIVAAIGMLSMAAVAVHQAHAAPGQGNGGVPFHGCAPGSQGYMSSGGKCFHSG
jgi:NAD-dependent SIR2 family protein deacetylase